MTISVIVPLYHGKKYINAIIEMMEKNLSTTQLKYKLELILVNDFPEEKICLSDYVHTERLSLVLVCNQQNQGIHYSRVAGLYKASGRYIMFFDQDDRIADNYFESQLRSMRGQDVIVSNGVAQYASYAKLLYRYWFMQWTVKHIWFYAKFDCRIISPGQCLIKKDSIPDIWKDSILVNNGADDYFLWLLMLSGKSKFGINRDRIYTHIYTAENASLDYRKMSRSVNELLEKGDKYILVKYAKIIKERIQKSSIGDKKAILVKMIERINRE